MESYLKRFDGELRGQHMIEHHYCCHSMRNWRLESCLCGEDGIAVHCVVISHHLCEFLDVWEADHPSTREPANHALLIQLISI